MGSSREQSDEQPDSEDDTGYVQWQIYAGPSLVDANQDPIFIHMSPAVLAALEQGNPAYWQPILKVIEHDTNMRRD